MCINFIGYVCRLVESFETILVSFAIQKNFTGTVAIVGDDAAVLLIRVRMLWYHCQLLLLYAFCFSYSAYRE